MVTFFFFLGMIFWAPFIWRDMFLSFITITLVSLGIPQAIWAKTDRTDQS